MNVIELLKIVLTVGNGFVFQVSNCLWTLDVTVLVIDMKHAEKRNGQFCCCDQDECENDPNNLGICRKKCDVLFHVTVSPCTDSTSPKPCSVFTDEIEFDRDSDDYIYGYFFHFMTTAQAKKVGKCTYTQSMCVCLCMCGCKCKMKIN